MNTLSSLPMAAGVFTWPNLISALRLVSVPLGLWLAWREEKNAFLICLALQLLSDCLDGFLARRLKQSSPLGAQLDSLADLAMWMSAPFALWWLWPGIIGRELGWLLLGVTSYVVPVGAGFWKYGRLTSYHTWSAKASSIATAIGLLVLLTAHAAWPFRAAIILTTLSGLEELVLTALLRHWQANVPSVWHAWRRPPLVATTAELKPLPPSRDWLS